MDMQELKQKSEKERTALEHELRERVRMLRFEDSSGALKDVRDIREARKTIARIMTLRTAGTPPVKA